MSDLIESLAQDLKPVRVLPNPWVRFGRYLLMALAYSAVALALLGVNRDMAQHILTDISFLMDTALMLLVGLSAGAAAFHLCVPDLRARNWLLVLPAVFLSVFVLWKALAFMSGQQNDMHIHADHFACALASAVFFAVPALIVTVMTAARGATTHPLMQLVMNSLCVGALGYVPVRLFCGIDSLGHDLVFHIAPFLFLGTALGVLARRFFKW